MSDFIQRAVERALGTSSIEARLASRYAARPEQGQGADLGEPVSGEAKRGQNNFPDGEGGKAENPSEPLLLAHTADRLPERAGEPTVEPQDEPVAVEPPSSPKPRRPERARPALPPPVASERRVQPARPDNSEPRRAGEPGIDATEALPTPVPPARFQESAAADRPAALRSARSAPAAERVLEMPQAQDPADPDFVIERAETPARASAASTGRDRGAGITRTPEATAAGSRARAARAPELESVPLPLPGESARSEKAPAPPQVRITIGRIEVRAAPAAPASPGNHKTAGPRLSIDGYLRRRAERK